MTDQQKAVVPGAEVTLLDIATNSTRISVTNEAGRYSFVNVPPGTYDISVGMAGFSTAKLSGQKVTVGQELTISVVLAVGALTETVEVTASVAAELQTSNATIGSTISGQFLTLLPNLARDAAALVTLQVGVTPSGQVAGMASDQSTFQIDGGNTSDTMSGNQSYRPILSGLPTGAVPAPVESLEEFKVATSNQTADFSGSGGSQVQMVTKRGSNQWHGALYEYYYGDTGAANTWLNNHTASGGKSYTPLPVTHRNRFGASAGGPMLPHLLGGKTYIFSNYEGYRFPNQTNITRLVPTPLLRAGVIQLPNSSGVYVPYNLNPNPVTVNGVTYQPAKCGTAGTPCDPRGLGLNPIVSQVWSKFMPLPNTPQAGDTYNTQGYLTTVSLPTSSNTFVTRIDHDFGPKWHFMASYRYFKNRETTSSQLDIGGALPGHTLGQAVSTSQKPANVSYIVAGMTTTINSRLTNDFRFSYLRNWWLWATSSAPPQLPGLGGAIEPGGESANALIPYNVNSSGARQRYWNGQDKTIRDDLSWLKGNHMFQFGGQYFRNFVDDGRDDNGTNMLSMPVYQMTAGVGVSMTSAYQPTGLPANQVNNWNNFYAQVLGIVNQSQIMYTREGAELKLNPIGQALYGKAVIPNYNVYFSDTWRLRPKVTLTYGLGYILSMPPTELEEKQNMLVFSDTLKQVSSYDYLQEKQKAALAGQVYRPGVAYGNRIKMGLPYVYDPYYLGLSPRVAAAWNVNFGNGFLGKIFGQNETVIRGGYSRILGRMNGIKPIHLPMLGIGPGQAVSCIGASRTGQCLGNGGVDPTTAFRIGADGMSAPLPAVTENLVQPYNLGVGGNAPAADTPFLTPQFRPNRSDQFTLTIQRAISQKLMLEFGYIGRIIRNEYAAINLNAVPYMMTVGGQRFDAAFAKLYTQVSAGQATVDAQPFFEGALGGTKSAYCTGYASCTAAVAAKLRSAILSTQVFNLWSTLDGQSSWTLGPTLLSSKPAQISGVLFGQGGFGYGNYNAGFFSFTAKDWHGIGARSNFTWGRAFGTNSVDQSASGQTFFDVYNLKNNYGPSYDIKFIYNLTMLYQPQYFKSQKGFLGRVLGGWSFAPIFTAQSGPPLRVSIGTGTSTNCQSIGQTYCNSNNSDENAILTAPYTAGSSAHYGVSVASGAGLNGNASRGGSGINMFEDPNAVYGQFRRFILGIDERSGGAGVLRGFPAWNVDMTVSKDFRATESVGATLMFSFTNIMNHFQPANPTLNIDSPQTWGVVSNQSGSPRLIEFGLRIRF